MTRPSSTYSMSRPGGPGISEKEIHSASGLRIANLAGLFFSDFDGIVDAFTPANNSAFTAMTFVTNAGRLPVPMTPAITLTHGNVAPAAHTFQIRLKGYDQFGNFQTELLPKVTTAPTDQNDVFVQIASKVFAVITEVAYTLAGFQTSTVFDVGWRFIWDAAAFDAGDGGDNQIHGGANMAIGSPLKLAPYGPALGQTQQGTTGAVLVPDVLSLVCVNHTNTDAVISVPPWNGTEGFRAGISAAGYQGTPHKVNIVLDTTGGDGTFPTMAGGTDDLAEADTISFFLNVRSTMGTVRGNSPKSSYPR